MAVQSNKEFLSIPWCATFGAFRLFTKDNEVAMKIMLSSNSERCYYTFHRDLVFQMTYLMQCGPWFVLCFSLTEFQNSEHLFPKCTVLCSEITENKADSSTYGLNTVI